MHDDVVALRNDELMFVTQRFGCVPDKLNNPSRPGSMCAEWKCSQLAAPVGINTSSRASGDARVAEALA